MFLPYTARAIDMQRFTPEQLAAAQKCMCGKEVRLSECLVSWTHHVGKDDWGYYATCGMGCLVVHLSQGSC